MSKFPQHDEHSAPPASRAVLARHRQVHGFLPRLSANVAESPALLEAQQSLDTVFARSALNQLQRSIVLLTVSRYYQCAERLIRHSVDADFAKIPHEVTNAIRDDRPIDEPMLETLRAFTGHLLERQGRADSQRIVAMRDAGYSDRQVLDVLIGVALETLLSQASLLTRTESDEQLAWRAWHPPTDGNPTARPEAILDHSVARSTQLRPEQAAFQPAVRRGTACC